MSSYSVCDQCGEDIIWALTMPARKRMPIDPGRADRDETYANLAVRRDHLGSLFVRVLKKDEEPMVTEHRGVPHFATCKKRNQPKQVTSTAPRNRLPDNVTPLRRNPTNER